MLYDNYLPKGYTYTRKQVEQALRISSITLRKYCKHLRIDAGIPFFYQHEYDALVLVDLWESSGRKITDFPLITVIRTKCA
jgi:hypothetical protein